MITTVLGDIEDAALGFCQSHEHLSIDPGCPSPVPADQCIDDPEKSRLELEAYRYAGGGAVVDAQGLGCGRDAAALARISRESSVHIVATTGFHKMQFYPEGHWIYSAGADQITRLYLAELGEGMFLDGDGAKIPVRHIEARAGLIKSALDAGEFTSQYQKLFTAALEAAKISGAALMVHIEKGSDPEALAVFLEKQGLDPHRIVFCHLDRAVANTAVHRAICARSISLEFDTIGRPKYHDDRTEIGIILPLLEAGYENRLLMSLDTTRARLKSYGGTPGLTYILEQFIPLMRGSGITEEQIDLFFRKNPARLLCRTF